MLSRTPDSHETHMLIADWRMYITSPSSCSAPSALRDVGQFHYDECQFDARDIWFSCETDISEDCAFIHFDGLAGIVDVFWNDTLLVRYDNMFVRHSLDVQRHQLRGKGVLSLRFVALNTLLAER